MCGTPFITRSYKQSTCSIICRDSITSQNGTLKRRIKYKEFTFQSTWEITIAKFLDNNDIIWEQPRKRFKWFDLTLKKNRTYLPDFYLPEYSYYLDVKNPYKQSVDADKLSQLKNLLRLYVGDIRGVKDLVVGLRGLEPPTIQSTTFEA